MNTVLTRKTKLITVTAVLIVLSFILALIGSPGRISAASDGQPTKRTINVSAQGSVKATPDVAYVEIGVITENENANVAQQNNADIMSKVVNAIKESGVVESDIKTTNYYISPKYIYDRDTGKNEINGYTVTNQVQVTVRDIKKTGNIIDVAASNGANMSSNITFAVSNYELYYNQALKIAVENAKKRAETIAGAIGITLGTPVSVSESGGYYSPTVRVSFDSMAKNEVATTPISAGTFDISASVSMTYEY